MSKPKYQWWEYAKSMVRRYPDRVNEAEKMAVQSAIEETKLLPTGKTRMDIVEMVLLRGSHTVADAAHVCCVSPIMAKAYHADFIRSVGKHFSCRSLIPN